MYRFIRGRVCSPEDLRRESVWRGVARRLGEWHALLPIVSEDGTATTATDVGSDTESSLSLAPAKATPSLATINAITPGKSTPNLWTVMQKWIFALPATNEAEIKRKAILQKELERTVSELGDTLGLGKDGVRPLPCHSSNPFANTPSSLFSATATSSQAT